MTPGQKKLSVPTSTKPGPQYTPSADCIDGIVTPY